MSNRHNRAFLKALTKYYPYLEMKLEHAETQASDPGDGKGLEVTFNNGRWEVGGTVALYDMSAYICVVFVIDKGITQMLSQVYSYPYSCHTEYLDDHSDSHASI